VCAIGRVLVGAQRDVPLLIELLLVPLPDEVALDDPVLLLELHLAFLELEFELLGRVRLERQRAVGVGRPDGLAVGRYGDVLHARVVGHDR